jgi:two-component system sensor histidine kinase/response regulator
MNANLKDARILIVDDQESNIAILEDLLSIKGYTQVKVTSDAREVTTLVEAFKPDILLLDLMMPHMSGFEVMELLKSKGKINGFMPILVLTADATVETKQHALKDGASDFLAKPFDLTEVDLRIRNLLQTVYLLSQLRDQNLILEEKVKERTKALVEINNTITAQNETLRDIAWTQSHIVRAPLARMLGIISLLEAEIYSEELSKEQMLKLIVDSANELDGIIRDISSKAYDSKIFENVT